mgnify:CR=1 FL=1
MNLTLKCLISAGPTREWIDAARFISNPSSGKMGFALAEEARDSGMEVTLISGPVNLPNPDDILVRRVETCLEMKEVIMEYFSTSDLIIMSAAVSDHRPKFPVTAKMNKGEFPASLEMEPNPDILQDLGKLKSSTQTLVGFAAETNDHLAKGKSKLIRKNLDWIVVNDISNTEIAFGSDLNEITILSKEGDKIFVPLSSKKKVAGHILEIVCQ